MGYNSDKFGEVTKIERGARIDTVFFTTNSGFTTWRASKNLTIYHGERGDINAEAGVDNEYFFESREK